MKPTTLASRITALSLIEILEHDRAASDRLLPRRWIARLRPPHHDDKTTPHSVCRPGESPPRTAPTCRALVTSIADAIRLHRGIPPWPGFAIAVSRDSIIKSFLEYNLRMSLRGNGFSRSVQSLDIRLVVDRIPAFTWSAWGLRRRVCESTMQSALDICLCDKHDCSASAAGSSMTNPERSNCPRKLSGSGKKSSTCLRKLCTFPRPW